MVAVKVVIRVKLISMPLNKNINLPLSRFRKYAIPRKKNSPYITDIRLGPTNKTDINPDTSLRCKLISGAVRPDTATNGVNVLALNIRALKE